MKKYLIFIVFIIALFITDVKAYELPKKTNHEKVTIYIFRGKGCAHCYDALEYFNNNYDKLKDYIDIKTYEVWNNENNYDFLMKVLEYQKKDYEGVPHIIIGTSYSAAGFQAYMAEDIISAALEEYKNKDYKDIVKQLSNDYNVNSTNLKEAWKEENGSDPKQLAIAIGIIAIIAIGGFIFIKKSIK